MAAMGSFWLQSFGWRARSILFRSVKKTQNGGSLCLLVLVKKDDISKLVKDSDAENTKRQRKYAVSRMYLKNYDIIK